MLTEQFAAAAAAAIGPDGVPGLVAVMAHGDDAHVEVRGALAMDGPPMRRDTLFRVSSTTKPITAAATLALVDEGLLGLDEPVTRLLPEMADLQVLRRPDGPLEDTVPAEREVTVRDLLTFTHGFGMDLGMFMAAEPWPVLARVNELALATIGPPDPAVPPDPDTWIARMGTIPLLAQPGERWLYNTGLHVASVLLARAAGQPLPEVFRTRLFEPLGMSDTAFWTSDPARLATSYSPSLSVWDEPDGKWSRPPTFPDGAAGLLSTADDLLAFARMLLRGGAPVLSAESVAEMTRDQLTDAQKAAGGFGPQMFEGRGWGLGQAVITAGERAGAFGWDGGFGSSFLVDPVRDLAVIVLTQRMFPSPETPAVHQALQAAAYAGLA